MAACYQTVEDINHSLMAAIGKSLLPRSFAPLGFGDWKAAVASINGLVAKENLVSTFGILLWIC